MSANTKIEKPFIFRFIDARPTVLLELTNKTEKTLKSIEILTVFLKDEDTPGGGPSQAHIKFDAIKSMQPKEAAVLSHRTWINGKPAGIDHDQLERLKVIAGEASPYVLDVSWEDAEGKTRFQRIPVGHGSQSTQKDTMILPQDTIVNELNFKKEIEVPVRPQLYSKLDIPLFLRDSSDGKKGDAQDEKDKTAE